MNIKDDWAPFHWELANKLLQYKDNRKKLAEIATATYEGVMGKEFKLRKSGKVTIDPFTIFSLFCRHLSAENRVKYLTAFAEVFKLKTPVPTTFTGLPEYKMSQSANFCYSASDEDIDTLWKFFEVALKYANSHSAENKKDVYDLFDPAVATKGNGFFKITKGLHLIAPKSFLNWDEMNQWYLFECKSRKIPDDVVQAFSATRGGKISAEDYFDFADKVEAYLNGGACELKNFQELNYEAVREATEENKRQEQDKEKEEEEEENKEQTERQETPVDNSNSGPEEIKEHYNRDKFLEQVFMGEDQYEKLVRLLKNKKNIILQGPPGVGKTFAARRLAWSMMGDIDDDRIKLVQFHQNYSYEDFVEGYKPCSKEEKAAGEEGEFVLRHGVFREFCDKAQKDSSNDYFLVIDEINRGNMSKIFGELLMLIEKDYRGDKYSLELAYSRKKFSVPENLYIIGMMNTADRSLAMLDYALRRRFGFFEMKPAFDSEGFKKYQEELLGKCQDENERKIFGKLIDWVKALNEEIKKDDSLGEGFRIGHSYFCGWEECTEAKMRDVLECDIIPTLKEYWFDNQTELTKWIKDGEKAPDNLEEFLSIKK